MLNDWNGGKLRYYTEPPEQRTETAESAKLVSELAKEFDLDAIDEDQSLVVQGRQILLGTIDSIIYCVYFSQHNCTVE